MYSHGRDLDPRLTVVDDEPRPAADHSEGSDSPDDDRCEHVRAVAIRRFVEHGVRWRAFFVEDDELLVVVACLHREDAGDGTRRDTAPEYDVSGRDPTLGRRDRILGEDDRRAGDEWAADEHRARHVLVPRIVGGEPHGRVELQHGRADPDSPEVERLERKARTIARGDDVRRRVEESRVRVRVPSRRAGADRERIGQTELGDVVRGGAVRRDAGRRGEVAARVQQPEAAVRQGRDTGRESRERQATDVRIRHLAGQEPFIIRVATHRRAGHGDHHHAVRVAVEGADRVLQPRRHFRGARIVHDYEGLDVRPGGDGGEELGAVHAVARFRVADLLPELAVERLAGENDRHRAGGPEITGLPNHADVALFGRGRRHGSGDGAGGGGIGREGREGEEKERVDHGLRPPDR